MSLMLLVIFYFMICWIYWKVARHYYPKFYFLTPLQEIRLWKYLEFSDKPLKLYVCLILIISFSIAVAVDLMIWSSFWG